MLLESVCAKMDDYVRDSSLVFENYLPPVLFCCFWRLTGPYVDYRNYVGTINPGCNTINLVEYEISLCNFGVWDTHFDHPNVRVPGSMMTPWLKVGPSSKENGGYGLFALRTFRPNDIITVYVGPRSGKRQNSPYALEKNGVTIDPCPIPGKHPLYLGAHFCNDEFQFKNN